MGPSNSNPVALPISIAADNKDHYTSSNNKKIPSSSLLSSTTTTITAATTARRNNNNHSSIGLFLLFERMNIPITYLTSLLYRLARGDINIIHIISIPSEKKDKDNKEKMILLHGLCTVEYYNHTLYQGNTTNHKNGNTWNTFFKPVYVN